MEMVEPELMLMIFNFFSVFHLNILLNFLMQMVGSQVGRFIHK